MHEHWLFRSVAKFQALMWISWMETGFARKSLFYEQMMLSWFYLCNLERSETDRQTSRQTNVRTDGQTERRTRNNRQCDCVFVNWFGCWNLTAYNDLWRLLLLLLLHSCLIWFNAKHSCKQVYEELGSSKEFCPGLRPGRLKDLLRFQNTHA
jgi:hypothetical protein